MTELDLGFGGRGHSTSPASDTPHPSALLAAIEHATACLLDVVHGMDERSVHRPSLLPNWTRAHVISHLARNADGCVNLLTWARTGVEHPMYASKEDRDADIREGSARSHSLLVEDLRASCARFAQAVRKLPSTAWSAEVVGAPGKPIVAYEILRSRLLEVWVHLVDLDHGVGFDTIPGPDLEQLLDDTVRQFAGRPDMPAITITTDFRDDRSRSWTLGSPRSGHRRVHGDPGALLGWLLGRHGGDPLDGDVPELPTWL